jgi:hypothetical protein
MRIDESGNTIEEAIAPPEVKKTYEHYAGWEPVAILEKELKRELFEQLSISQGQEQKLADQLSGCQEAERSFIAEQLAVAQRWLKRISGEIFTLEVARSPIFKRTEIYFAERLIWVDDRVIEEKLENGTLEVYVRGRLDHLRGKFYQSEITCGLLGMAMVVRKEILRLLIGLFGDAAAGRLIEEITETVKRKYVAPPVAIEWQGLSAAQVRMVNRLATEEIVREILRLRSLVPQGKLDKKPQKSD